MLFTRNVTVHMSAKSPSKFNIVSMVMLAFMGSGIHYGAMKLFIIDTVLNMEGHGNGDVSSKQTLMLAI